MSHLITKIYAFDVDETLEISNGPVTLQSMMDLRVDGHIVGVVGNWGKFVQCVPGWQHLVSFINITVLARDESGKVHGDKDWYLQHLAKYVAADEYVMVGNVFGDKNSLGFVCGSHDSEAAAAAGWRFIKEDDFAAGAR